MGVLVGVAVGDEVGVDVDVGVPVPVGVGDMVGVGDSVGVGVVVPGANGVGVIPSGIDPDFTSAVAPVMGIALVDVAPGLCVFSSVFPN